MKYTVFDPFNDFDINGYLRNYRKDKNPQIIKHIEHQFFEANVDRALDFLASCHDISYKDFLEVHRILFLDYYPWAGQDRAAIASHCAIRQGEVLFSHPQSAQLAVEQGLRMGKDKTIMNKKPGEIMGLFAYGHSFLDGNGRTMLLVHIELCHRAGFFIDWSKTDKSDYLTALSQEIEMPGKGTLDSYLLQFKSPKMNRDDLRSAISSINGLNGLDKNNQVDGSISDPAIAEKYKKFEQQRSYTLNSDEPKPSSRRKRMR